MLKLNKLFLYETRPEPFGRQIEPEPWQKRFLVECKNKIRDHLRDGIRQASKTVLGMDAMVTPKFRTQGSWMYQTCVRPAELPPQQMDWDYGVYLPAKLWENQRPKVAAKVYSELVEGLLQGLCKQEGWKLLEGRACKDTCIRIEVDSWAHIDIPLYAAPEEQFALITERVEFAQRSALNKAQAGVLDTLEEEPFAWEDLETIVMATRAGEWKPSDPGAVAQWFQDCISVHGEQLQRICRYVKAWRDFHWTTGGPSSILLMIIVARGFVPNPRRDDLVLEEAAARLASELRGNVYERAIGDGTEDFNRLSATERTFAADAAASLRAALRQARGRSAVQKAEAINDLRRQLGDRIPFIEDWVELEAGAIDAVQASAPQYVPSPKVKTTTAG